MQLNKIYLIYRINVYKNISIIQDTDGLNSIDYLVTDKFTTKFYTKFIINYDS